MKTTLSELNLAFIVALGSNKVIGRNNQLPWRLPDDLKHFKAMTLNKFLLVGRKTYDSLGGNLPHRKMIVMTRDKHFKAEGALIIHQAEELVNLVSKNDEVMIGGGAEIFKIFLPYVKTLYLTEVKAAPEGDAYFPDIDMSAWQEISRLPHPQDDRHDDAFDMVTYRRR